MHVIASHPALLWQQAINTTSSSAVFAAAEEAGGAGQIMGTAGSNDGVISLAWSNKIQGQDECLLTLPELPQVWIYF